MDNSQNRTKNLFDRINNFRKAFTNQYGLMMSTINFKKPMDSYNKDSATEADENMAMGLLMAHYQWGSSGKTNYLAEATALINNISANLVERPAYALKPAVTWGGSNCINPCYYDPMYYSIWSKLTGDTCWAALDEKYQSLVTYFINQYGTGLLPDWCKIDGTSTGLSDKPYYYSWDAQQISTKWAIYYAWYGTTKTNVYFNAAQKFAAWIKKQSNGNLSSMVDSYMLDGKPCGTYAGTPGVLGDMGLSGTVSSEHQDLVNKAYTALLTLDSGVDYNFAWGMWKVVQSLIYSGNFVNFTN
jgi:endo-1,4-beta-D-glucanase Y